MITSNINGIFFKVLSESDAVKESIKGEIFNGDRPLDRNEEDITIVAISESNGRPKTGETNINIHVPDIMANYDGYSQQVADLSRLEEISAVVEKLLSEIVVTGFAFKVEGKSVIETAQDHYYSYRLSWVAVSESVEIARDYYTKSETIKILSEYAKTDDLREVYNKLDKDYYSRSEIAVLLEKYVLKDVFDKAIEKVSGDISEVAENLDAFDVALSGRIDTNKTNIENLKNIAHTQNTDTQLAGGSVEVLESSVNIGKKTLTADEITANVLSVEKIVSVTAEEVSTEDNNIILRKNAETALPANKFAGVRVLNYDGEHTGVLGLKSDGTAYCGDEGDERPLMTRASASEISDKNFLSWDSSTTGAVDSGISVKSVTDLQTTSGEHTKKISDLETTSKAHGESIEGLSANKVDKSSIWYGSLAEYNAMTSHDVNVRYYIEEV